MLSPQRWEFVVLYLALDRLQAVFLGLNTRHQLPELELVLNDAKPSVLLTVGHFNGRDYLRDAQSLRGRCPSISTLVAIGPDSTDTDSIDTGSPEELTFEDLLKAGSSPPGLPRAVSATEPACIVYTSGSTGRPKGAVLPPARIAVKPSGPGPEGLRTSRSAPQCDHPIDHCRGQRPALSGRHPGRIPDPG